MHQRAPLRRRNHRRAQDRTVSVISSLFKDITLSAKTGLKGHDNGFAQRIDRRIGHLGKLLTEVVIDRANPAGQYRHRGIVAHGTNRFLTILGQRTQYLITLFEGDLEHFHILLQTFGAQKVGAVIAVIKLCLNTQGIFFQPLAVGVARFEAIRNIIGMQHFTGFGIDCQNLTRTNAAFTDHVFRLVIPHADF